MQQPRGAWRQFRDKPCGTAEYADQWAFSGGGLPAFRERKRQLASGGAATDYGNAFRMTICRQCREPLAKPTDGFYRNTMVHGTGDGGKVRLTADVQRQDIKAHRWASRHADHAGIGVNAGDRGMDHAGARHGGKARQVDMNVAFLPHPLDIARQHAGIGCVDVTAYQRGPEAFDRLHGQ